MGVDIRKIKRSGKKGAFEKKKRAKRATNCERNFPRSKTEAPVGVHSEGEGGKGVERSRSTKKRQEGKGPFFNL